MDQTDRQFINPDEGVAYSSVYYRNIPQDRHLHGSRLGGPVRDLRCITQKYTNYAETHDLRVFAVYAIYAEIPFLRSFYAALRSQIHYASYSGGGGMPPPPGCERNDA